MDAFRLTPLFSAMALVLATPALADDTPRDSGVERLTVIGQKIARTEQETTDSVAVFNNQEINALPSFELGDLLNRVPGVQRDAFGYHIRGISQAGAGTGAGTAETISTRVDGAVISGVGNWYGPFSLWDMDQVAVYRGPQSTSQGQNALAGAIVLQSAAPHFDTEAAARLGIGNYGQQLYSVMANTPVLDDTLALRASYDEQRSDGFIDNPTRGIDDAAKSVHRSGRVALRYLPKSDLDITLRLSSTDNTDGVNAINSAAWRQDHSRIDYSNAPHRWTNRVNIADLTVKYDLSPYWQLFGEANYSDQDLRRDEDSDYSAADLGHTHSSYRQNARQLELRGNYDNGENLRGVVGLYYYNMNRDQDLNVALATSVYIPNIEQMIGYDPIVYSQQYNHYDASNKALFSEWDYRFASHWQITAGLRIDQERRQNDEFVTAYTVPAVPPALSGLIPEDQLAQGDVTNTEWLPKFSLGYLITPDMSLTLTYQRAYRAGGSGTNLGGNPIYNYRYDPEYTNNVELALRSAWLDQQLFVNANLYYIDWRDQQVQVRGDSTNSLDYDVRNAGRSTVQGLELSIDWQLADWFKPFFSAAYNKTEFKDFTTLDTSGSQLVDLSGNSFANAPRFTASVGAESRWANWFGNLQYSYRSRSYIDIYNQDCYPSYGLLSAKLGYEAANWTLSLYGQNLLNREYMANYATVSRLQAGAPRTFGLMLEVQY